MDNQYFNLDPKSKIRDIIEQWRNNPLVNTVKYAKKYNMHLVYPMLIIFDNKANFSFSM